MTHDYIFLFADVVRYSLMIDEHQEGVIAALTRAVEAVFPGSELLDRSKGLFLATGDGFAVGFRTQQVHDQPQTVLTLAEELQRKVAPFGSLRIGLHRGPARCYPDFNARFLATAGIDNNLAGAAVNLTQRVMSLADPGGVLASDAFFHHYRATRGEQEASQKFRYAGTVRIKHGGDRPIYQFQISDNLPVPARMSAYATAQKEILSSINEVLRKVFHTVAGPKRHLELRGSVFLFDSATSRVVLSGLRQGTDLDRSDPVPAVSFALTEGPGILFQQALTDRAPRAAYHELPPPPPATTLDNWARAAAARLRVTEERARKFVRPSACYMYFSLHFAGAMRVPFGVIAIDLLRPVFNRQNIADQLRTDRRLRKKDVEKLVDERVGRKMDKLERRLNPFLRRIEVAYTLITHM